MLNFELCTMVSSPRNLIVNSYILYENDDQPLGQKLMVEIKNSHFKTHEPLFIISPILPHM